MKKKITVRFLALLWAFGLADPAMAREIYIPDYEANPGGYVDLPVMLDDAGGICMVDFQVNYEASILQLISVTLGPLGRSFSEFSNTEESGVIRVNLANATDLASGSGALIIIRFKLLDGADGSVTADVALASYDYSNSSGVVALSLEEAASATSGKVQTVYSPTIDNFGNQLPDHWEDMHGLDKFSLATAASDSDGDGASALLEYGLNGNPGLADSADLFALSRKPENPSIMQLSMRLRTDDSSLSYYLGASDNLIDWDRYPITWDGTAWVIENPLGTSIGESINEGYGIWSLKLEVSIDAGAKQFFRVEVERE